MFQSFFRHFRRGRHLPVILVLVACLGLIAGVAIVEVRAHTLRQQVAATDRARQAAARSQPKNVKTAPLPTDAPMAAPTPAATTPAVTPTAKQPASPKPAPAPAKPQLSACDQNRSAFYVQHTAAISQEYQTHQQNLAELKQHYDNGDYYQTSEQQAFEDYQADVNDENIRWQQADAAIDANYAAQLRSVGCPVYL